MCVQYPYGALSIKTCIESMMFCMIFQYLGTVKTSKQVCRGYEADFGNETTALVWILAAYFTLKTSTKVIFR